MENLEAYDATGCAHSAAALAGVDPKTVRRYAAARDAGRPVTGPGRRPRMIDAYLPKIEEWVERSQGTTLPTLIGCRDATLALIGGVPTYVLTDNPRTVTVDHVAGVPVRHPQIVQVGRYYGTQVHTCVPYDPQSKGGSEFTVRIAKADLVPAEANLREHYASFAALEAACAAFCAKVNERTHRESARVPDQALVEEQQRLHVAPAAPHTAALGVTRTVGTDQTIRFGSPDGDGAQYGPAAVGQRELVVAGREASPLLENVEGPLDDVAALVVLGIEGRGSTTLRAPAFPVAGLVSGLGDHCGDPSGSQMRADGSRGVGLVRPQPPGPGPGPPWSVAGHPQVGHQMREHRGVPGLPRAQEHHQRTSGAVDQGVDLAREPTAGAAYRVISRLVGQIRVVRSRPLCRGRSSWRADGPG
ncbi:hypothetical protein PLESTB_001921000 [Pleodorina starrii]|uniref:Integrase catalytic domain-containing protein n=1 Tax=Pleodorina starrii TaxID=330485 RepID=A0A9W6C2N5_9CHLO|nr:hypothetical protein PLESTB_001921000 [Pleodorina starrii]